MLNQALKKKCLFSDTFHLFLCLFAFYLTTTVREDWMEVICDAKPSENRCRVPLTDQSYWPLLSFHPDNASRSKVKTSPLAKCTLSAGLILDYSSECHHHPNINPAWNLKLVYVTQNVDNNGGYQ